MYATVECYNKVKKDCFKFLKLQETKTNKFKNKNKMLKSYLIPVCFWITKKSNKKSPLIIGLAGGQGTGKTTITSVIALILKKYVSITGLDPNKYGGHSLRSGFATSTAESGAEERNIMAMTGHKTTQMVRRYIQEANLFKNNALNKIKI